MNMIAFLGDVHADIRFMKAAIEQCAHDGAHTILQVGDFGIWDHIPEGEQFLDLTDVLLDQHDMWLTFCDGNHENFESLYGYPIADDGYRHVRSRILHAPRGHIWSIHDLTFMAMGGAHSIDGPGGPDWWPQARDLGQGWWPEEAITRRDAENAVANFTNTGTPVDIMIAHDVPSGVPIPGIKGYPAGDANRDLLAQIVEVVHPQLLVCGHYHRRHTGHFNQTRVEILAHNEAREGQYLYLDTDRFELKVEA